MADTLVEPNPDDGSVLAHLELVPVGVREPEDRAPLLLLDRLGDLDALLPERRLLPLRVLRGEEVSRVPLLRAGVGAEVETDVRAPRPDRDPMGERGHDAEADLVLPELRRLLLIPHDDCDRLELEHADGNRDGRHKPAV